MKINQNYLLNVLKLNNTKNINFGRNETNTVTNQAKDYNMNVTPDFNVSVPISYSKVGDIKLPEGLVANCYKLANGQRVVIVPKQGSTVVKSYVNTGSLNENDKIRGISHYIEHNLFNGSEALGDKVFFDEVNKMGAETNASTNFSVTDYYIESQLLEDTDLENKIKLHAGMLQTPKFLQEKLDKEKKVVDQEINMCLSNDISRAETMMLKNLFNIKSVAPDLVAGSTDNIDALTREDVVNYFNNNYYPSNMVTVITGEVNPDDTMKLISKYFNSKKMPSQQRYFEPLAPTQKPVRQDIISKKNEGAAKIVMGFCGPQNNNAKDKIYTIAVMQLMGGLANNRFKEIEKKYSTYINVSSERIGSRLDDPQAQIIEASLAKDYVEPFLQDIYSIIDNLSKNPPTPEEFEAVKNKIKKSNSIYMQSSAALNNQIGMDFLNGIPDKLTNYSTILDNMSYQDFITTAKKYFDLNKTSLVVVHPNGTKEEDIKNNYAKISKSQNISFTGRNRKTPLNANKIQQYVMPNNFNVVFNDVESDIVNYYIQFNNKDLTLKQAAITDILNDMLKNSGTIYRTKENADLICDTKGISQSLYSTGRAVVLRGDFPVNNTDIALNLFKEKIQCPQFSQQLLEQAKQHCRDIYSTVEPSAVDDFYKTIYKNTPNEYTIKDKLATLDSITLNDIVKYYSDIMNNSQAQVVVTGPFSKNPNLAQNIFNNTSNYGTVKPKNVELKNFYNPIEQTSIHTVETKRNQAEILEGFKYKYNGNIKDSLCLLILSDILGGSTSSRLFTDLREKRHLAYAVNSYYDHYEDIGTMTLQIKTTTNNTETGETSYENIKKSIDGFNENITKMTTEKVSKEELDSEKRALKTAFLSEVAMNSSQNSILASNNQTPYGCLSINQKFNLIDSITPDDILNTAKNVFASKPVYAISATKESLDANREYLQSLKNC